MPPRDIARRLAVLETADHARRERVQDRVLQQLSEDELDLFIAVIERHEAALRANTLLAVRDDEKRVLCRVEALTRADPETRPGYALNVPQEWMEACGYAS